MKAVLKLPTYRRLLIAYTLNELAYSIAAVSLAFLIYRRTGSAVGAMAFFLCAQFVPALISPAIVARVDQRSVRRVLPTLYGLEGLAYLALAWVASHFSLAPVLVLVLLDGIVAVTARALARAATVAVTSPVGLLRDGNAVTNIAFSLSYMAGPALGGVVVAVASASTALLINAGLFVVIVVTIATSTGLPGAALEKEPIAGRLRAAIAHARRKRPIYALLGMQAAALLFFTISIPVEVVLVQHSLHDRNPGDYGALLSAWGGGAVAGSAAYTRWRRLRTRVLIAASASSLGVGFAVMAVAPSLAVAIVGAAIAGVGNGVEAVAARTALQEHVEPSWMAMIMSLNESIFQAVPGAGIVIGGLVTELSGPRTALGLAAIGALAVALAAWIVLRPSVFPEETPDTARRDPLGPDRPAAATNR